MVKRDIYNTMDTSVVQSIAPIATTVEGAVEGAAADLLHFGAAAVAVSYGLWTSDSFLATVEESADDSTYTTVAAGNLQGSFSAVAGTATDSVVQLVGYTGTKRYIRAVVTATGSGAVCVIGANIVRAHPRHLGVNLME